MRLGAGPSSATLVNLHLVRRVALSQANIWSSEQPSRNPERAFQQPPGGARLVPRASGTLHARGFFWAVDERLTEGEGLLSLPAEALAASPKWSFVDRFWGCVPGRERALVKTQSALAEPLGRA
jgi:hypothetical protein